MTLTHSKTFASFLTAAAGLVCSLSATAHDIVLVPERGGVTVRYGHAQDWQVVDQRKLLEVQTFQTPGAPVEQLDALKPSKLNYLLAPSKLVAGQPFLVAARYDNGLWSRPKTTAGEKPKARNASRFMMPVADTVTNNLKFAKAISTAPTDEVLYKRTLGHVLELVPQKNPATLKAGEMLDVLVLLQGKPLAGAGIEVSNLVDKIDEDKIKRYTTNAAGIASVPLRAKGVHMLGVDVEKPNDGSLGDVAKAVGADKFVLVATFTFVR
jgi:nickel transport protein